MFGNATLLTDTLSVATTVNVTVCVLDELLSSTEVSSAPKLEIVGTSSSILSIVIVNVSVTVLPAPSTTVAVKVSVEVPKLKSS